MKRFKYTINSNVYDVAINSIDDTTANVEVNGTSYEVKIDKSDKEQTMPLQRSSQTSADVVSNTAQSTPASALKSPLPGIILDITCNVGDVIKKGQQILVLEAMKMENAINSDRDGVIKEIKVTKGESVLEGANLVIIG